MTCIPCKDSGAKCALIGHGARLLDGHLRHEVCGLTNDKRNQHDNSGIIHTMTVIV